MSDKKTITNTSAPARITAAGALKALSELLANGQIEYVSGGLVISPPDATGAISVTSDLVVKTPPSMRVH